MTHRRLLAGLGIAGLLLLPASAAKAFDVVAGSHANELNLRLFLAPDVRAQGAVQVELRDLPGWLTVTSPVSQPAKDDPRVDGMASVLFRFDVAPGVAPGTAGGFYVITRGEGGAALPGDNERWMSVVVASSTDPVQEIMVDDCCAALVTPSTYVPTKRTVLFSIPAMPVPPDAAFDRTTDLNDDLGASQIFYTTRTWNADIGILQGVTDFPPGRGFFLRDLVGTVGDSTLVDVSGAEQATAIAFETAALDSGFQEIGNPYLSNLAWDNTVEVTFGATTVPLDSAVALGWIEPAMWKFTAGETWSFSFAEDGDGALAPWEGGLVLPRVTGLKLRHAGGVPRSPVTAVTYDWRVELEASAAAVGFGDDNNYFGFAPGAAVQNDGRDVLGPFRPDNALDLFYDNGAWGAEPGRYMQDIRPPAEGTVSWPVGVVLTGSASQSVTVSWPDLSQVPSGFPLRLIDVAAADTTDMRAETSYTFTSGASGSVRSLLVEVDATGLTSVPGVSASVPQRFLLEQNQPNPFNPVTQIRFGVPAGGAHVALRVFDVQGRLVRTLHDGFTGAGYHTASWNGRSETGEKVQSGVYFFRLETPRGIETRKMTLLQ